MIIPIDKQQAEELKEKFMVTIGDRCDGIDLELADILYDDFEEFCKELGI